MDVLCVLLLLLIMDVWFIHIIKWLVHSHDQVAFQRMNMPNFVCSTFDGLLAIFPLGAIVNNCRVMGSVHPPLSQITGNCFPKWLYQWTLSPRALERVGCSTSSWGLPICCQSLYLRRCHCSLRFLFTFIYFSDFYRGWASFYVYLGHVGFDFLFCDLPAYWFPPPLKNAEDYFFIFYTSAVLAVTCYRTLLPFKAWLYHIRSC